MKNIPHQRCIEFYTSFAIFFHDGDSFNEGSMSMAIPAVEDRTPSKPMMPALMWT